MYPQGRLQAFLAPIGGMQQPAAAANTAYKSAEPSRQHALIQ
ncbi:hypothetical protein ACVNIS_17220 [Sphaerotilaceae bacterium SBD11-9]